MLFNRTIFMLAGHIQVIKLLFQKSEWCDKTTANVSFQRLFDLVFNKFLPRFLTADNNSSDRERSEINSVVYLNVPCTRKESRRFVSRLAKLFHVKFDVKVSAIYKTFKTGTCFQLQSRTPLLLCSNVVYKFTCSCDSNLTYIGKSTGYLSTRVGEHLNVASQHENSAIKQHIFSCTVCYDVRHDLNSFEVLKQCKSDFQTTIYEALLIKKHRPSFNKQLHANGSSFLLNIYK